MAPCPHRKASPSIPSLVCMCVPLCAGARGSRATRRGSTAGGHWWATHMTSSPPQTRASPALHSGLAVRCKHAELASLCTSPQHAEELQVNAAFSGSRAAPAWLPDACSHEKLPLPPSTPAPAALRCVLPPFCRLAGGRGARVLHIPPAGYRRPLSDQVYSTGRAWRRAHLGLRAGKLVASQPGSLWQERGSISALLASAGGPACACWPELGWAVPMAAR